MPGVHQPEAGHHRIVWWDPYTLQLGLHPPLGLAQVRLLQTDHEGRTQEGLSKWETWNQARSQIVQAGKLPSRVMRTASQGTLGRAEGAQDIQIVDARWSGERPSGARFGSLVHALLATVQLEDDAERIAGHADLHAGLFGASERERDAAIHVTAAALRHPLMRRAAAADCNGHCRRESTILVQLEDGSLVEGVADLVFREENAWVIVDFKTDADLSGREEVYRHQVATYVRGVRVATGVAAEGYLLLV
jgi:ATP-dependent exoDNAse (exonuclease V) beta subunit